MISLRFFFTQYWLFGSSWWGKVSWGGDMARLAASGGGSGSSLQSRAGAANARMLFSPPGDSGYNREKNNVSPFSVPVFEDRIAAAIEARMGNLLSFSRNSQNPNPKLPGPK